MDNLTLALDAMGGDFGPHVALSAAIKSIKKHPQLHLVLVGPKDVIQKNLQDLKYSLSPRLSIHHAPQVVTMDCSPVSAIRQGNQSSMRLALELVKQGKAQGCISSGNTGALLAMSKIILGTVPHIDRPALVTPIPYAANKFSYLLDIGANLNCDSDTLYQFALMGSAHYEVLHGAKKPKIALLNVGKEAIKGTDQIQRAALLLESCSTINYVGFVEGDDLFNGVADIIVCDGFVGNVVLKASEGLLKNLWEQPSQSENKLEAYFKKLLKPWIRASLPMAHPECYNGATFLGLKNIVIKSHGNAKELAYMHAIDKGVMAVTQNLPHKISEHIMHLQSNRS